MVKTSSDLVRKPKDCSDSDLKHATSGVYRIYPTAGRGFKVYCDMKTDGGRWTVLIRQMHGSQNFNKNWIEYENGFGDLKREFWLGNKYLHTLTSVKNTEMRVDKENFKGEKRDAKYSKFSIRDAASKYKLTVGGYSGNGGNAFAATNHNGMKFRHLIKTMININRTVQHLAKELVADGGSMHVILSALH